MPAHPGQDARSLRCRRSFVEEVPPKSEQRWIVGKGRHRNGAQASRTSNCVVPDAGHDGSHVGPIADGGSDFVARFTAAPPPVSRKRSRWFLRTTHIVPGSPRCSAASRKAYSSHQDREHFQKSTANVRLTIRVAPEPTSPGIPLIRHGFKACPLQCGSRQIGILGSGIKFAEDTIQAAGAACCLRLLIAGEKMTPGDKHSW